MSYAATCQSRAAAVLIPRLSRRNAVRMVNGGVTLRLFEQLFRRGAVVLLPASCVLSTRAISTLSASIRACRLLDRHRVEVLLRKRDERIVGLAREKIVRSMAAEIVDHRGPVNKPRSRDDFPSKMKAVVAPPADGNGGLVIVDRPVPQPGLAKSSSGSSRRGSIGQTSFSEGPVPPPPGAPDMLALRLLEKSSPRARARSS